MQMIRINLLGGKEEAMPLPKDPYILLSYVNVKLPGIVIRLWMNSAKKRARTGMRLSPRSPQPVLHIIPKRIRSDKPFLRKMQKRSPVVSELLL